MPNFGQCHYYPTILRWICSMFSEEVETQYMCQACIEANKAYCWDCECTCGASGADNQTSMSRASTTTIS